MKRRVVFLFSLGLALGVNLFFRLFPLYFPQLKTQARHIIEQRIYSEAEQQVHSRYPEFPAPAKSKLIKAFVAEYKKRHTGAIQKQIYDEYLKLKAPYQDEQGHTYLMELDCWHWARYTENVLLHGYPADTIKNGQPYDTFMLAPSGAPMSWNNFLFYISASLYKLFSFFIHIPLYTFLFYLPLFFLTVFIIVVYLFCFYHWGNLAALTSSICIGLMPFFLARSSPGWFDMDILNLLLPLVTLWAYLKAATALSLKSKYFWVCIASFWVGLFSFTWIGWWFIFLIIITYELYTSTHLLLRYWLNKEPTLRSLTHHFSSLAAFVIFSFAWIVIFSGFTPFDAALQRIKTSPFINAALTDTIWPNTFHFVAELKPLTLAEIRQYSGGGIFFALSLIALFALYMKNLTNREHSSFARECINLLLAWFLVIFYACAQGSRFIMFLLIPLGISLGWMAEYLYQYFKGKGLLKAAFLILWALMIAITIKNADRHAKSIYPLINDSWYSVLQKVEKTTPQGAILNSWWDFGDWFKVIAKRRVIFDGQSQQYPQAYWMAKALISNDERHAIAILRMLNNGGNRAFDIINAHVKDAFKSIRLLEKALFADKEEARKTLFESLPAPLTEELMQLLFKTPSSAYFIVDPTMIHKMAAISYLGNWDFLKSYFTRHRQEKQKLNDYLLGFGVENKTMGRFFEETALLSNKSIEEWLSRQSVFYSGIVRAKKQNTQVLFDNGIVYAPAEKTIHLYSNGRYITPKKLFIFENGDFEEIPYPEAKNEYAVLMFRKNDEYIAIVLDPLLAKSLFARLQFLRGEGLTHFKPFLDDQNEFGMQVYEIKWD